MKVVTDNKHYTDIAEAIREKTATTTTYKPEEMANGVNGVYDAGKEAERKAFWETYQIGGNRKSWQYAFAYTGTWTDDTYNPVYPIIISGVNDNMYHQAQITSTKVPIIVDYSTLRWTFRLTSLVEIDITFSEKTTTYHEVFAASKNLSSINAKGTIAASVSFSDCPLIVESMKSIISCLKDCAGTDYEGTYTLTLKDSCKTALEADTETVEYNGASYTYFELISVKGWNLA